MISKILIKNFKSLENVNIECSNLNVLTGLNGMGKSSIIQALLLLRQSYERGFLQNEGLFLNGDLVTIGVGKNALYQFADEDEITFDLDFLVENELVNNSWIFAYGTNQAGTEENFYDSDFMSFSEGVKKPNNLNNLSLFNNNTFRYLNADRWVKNEYSLSYFQVVRNKSLGIHGEFTAHYLLNYGTNKINAELMYPGTDDNSLQFQVSAWMNDISPGTKVITQRTLGSDSVRLRYTFEGNGIKTDEITPTNVGFGITYVLPVITALLSASPKDILIIENPESHIHPKGQSLIGKLMAYVAATGTQIFVETHSDHVINGIRVAVKGGIRSELIRLHFIKRDSIANKISSIDETPILDQDGRIDYWPADFFDEWDNNLMELL